MSKDIKELNDESLSQVTGGNLKILVFAGKTCDELRLACYKDKTGTTDMSKPLAECEQGYSDCTQNQNPLLVP